MNASEQDCQHLAKKFSPSWAIEPPMNEPITLSLEQEFSLRTFADQVQQMSREQAQGHCNPCQKK